MTPDEEDEQSCRVEKIVLGPSLYISIAPRDLTALLAHSRPRLEELLARLEDQQFVPTDQLTLVKNSPVPNAQLGVWILAGLERYDLYHSTDKPTRDNLDWTRPDIPRILGKRGL